MSVNTIEKLRDALEEGLSIFTRIWDYRVKDWVTSVCAADIDGDGDVEVIACSRDGRVYVLSKAGDFRWRRIIGTKAWVSAVAIGNFSLTEKETSTRIIVGTRDGKVYILDKDGRTITKDGRSLPFGADGRALDKALEEQACWYDTRYVIRQVYVDSQRPSEIIIGSEDRCAYGLDYETGRLLWKFPTRGRVRAVCAADINGDGEAEILIGSVDKNLYLLDHHGQLIGQHYTGYPVRTICASDIDEDGCIEVLVATDGKDLIALTPQMQVCVDSSFREKWRQPFENRLLSLCVTDLDKDGHCEIIASSEDKHIYILDNQGRRIWRHNHMWRVYSIYPCDIDNDGLPELLVGSGYNRIRAMRVRLRRGIEKKVNHYYRQLKKPDPTTITRLAADELSQLQDILLPYQAEPVTFGQALVQMNEREYLQALAILLKLEQQKVERLWYKNSIGHIRTICLRYTANEQKREIIVGNSESCIYAFRPNGRRAWSISMEEHIVDVQTGSIDQHKQEEIVICSSDHHVYILDGVQKQRPREVHIDDKWISSICFLAPSRQGQPEIIIGSEDKKFSIYSNDLEKPIATIPTEEGVRIVRAHAPTAEQIPEIIVAGLGNQVYAYKRNRRLLWKYETRDHIRAICIKDINSDGNIEVLIGSEDRNIHVLNSAGHLLWRYFLPHNVLSIDVADTNQDGRAEVFVSCADGYLYVFNKDGDLLWTYQAKDRICAIRVDDIDDDQNIEIALGAEDIFELLRVVNQQQINILISQCWQALQQQYPDGYASEKLLNCSDHLLQAFALQKLAEQGMHTDKEFNIFEKFAVEGSKEVRKTLVSIIPILYRFNSYRVRSLLHQLSTDNEPEVRNAVLEHLPAVMRYDWDLGFQYLKRAAENPDRFVRRLVIRKLHQLIDTPEGSLQNRKREIFGLLLTATRDEESEWIRQEAARTLAHFLDQHHGGMIIYMHLLIVNGMPLPIWKHIAHATVVPVIKRYINTVILMLDGLNEENVLERLQQIIQAQESVTSLLYGKDIQLIYMELASLFRLQSIAEIANYRCSLRASRFDSRNDYAPIILAVFDKLSLICRPLKMYFRREDTPDRLASLLETIEAIDKLSKFLDQQFSVSLLDTPLTKLPEHQVFLLLFAKWRNLVQAQLNALRGNAELKAELQTKEVRSDEQVSIWLTVRNTGRSSATDVKVSLLYNEAFLIVGSNIFETEIIFPGEETIAEFTLRPCAKQIQLRFEITYDDTVTQAKVEMFEDCLALREHQQLFYPIPNPYSTGTPTHDSKMFYGREADMLYLKDNLTREAEGVIVLYGQRRSGKTTILVQLVKSSILGEHIPVLIDMQRISYHITIDKLLRRLAYAIVQAMKSRNIFIAVPEQDDFKADPTYTFDLFLDKIEAQLAGHKLILLIDEFEVLEEQVTKGNLRPEIFEYLRDLVQYRHSIRFLFSGTHKITEHTKWYRSVFFNIALHYRLSRLSPQGAEDLIKKPVEGTLEYEPTALKKIRQLTADQPYLIHLMCRAIVDYCNERRKNYVTINDVNTVLYGVMQTGQFHFDWLWDQIKPDVRVVLAAMAEVGKEERRWLPFSEIEEIYRRYQIAYKYEYVLDALKTLLEADIIEDEPGDARRNTLVSHRFRISVGLTRGWLRREHPLEMVRKEMSG